MKIVFMGSAAFAVPSLDALQNARHEIVAVITQPDRPAGRGMRVVSPPVANEARQLMLPLHQPMSVRDAATIENIRFLKPELIVVVAYGKILPKEVIEIPRLGCVNVHASLLPKYRGAAPINWAIVRGEAETGVTTMFINEGLDAGDILLSKRAAISGDDTALTLHDRLAPIGAKLLIETIIGLKNKSIVPRPQDAAAATFAPILKKEDGLINWEKDALSIRNLVRGMQPWPSAYTYFEGKVLKIFDAEILDAHAENAPGTADCTGDLIVVATGKGKLLIKELQIEGKRRMESRDFLHGHKITNGTILG